MLFLMNDVVLAMEGLEKPAQPINIRALSMDFIMNLARERFAENPSLHKEEPQIAMRIASLLIAKAPEVNAALFVPPRRGCAPEIVLSRVASLSFDVMADLARRQEIGGLTPVVADALVWRRLAA
jgi:hypothetical protein